MPTYRESSTMLNGSDEQNPIDPIIESLPDYIVKAAGFIVNELRRDFERELERMRAEQRAIEEATRAILATFRANMVEMQAEWSKQFTIKLASLKDGEPGPKGERGERGEPGEAIVGATGPRGEQGERGEKGDKGDIGEQGPQGKPGETGRAGERGEVGEKGMAGERGERGEPGPAGESIVGQTGPEGQRGKRGERGERGEPGQGGPRGEQGERGESIIGPTGAAGRDGQDGAPGAPGKSFIFKGAYDPTRRYLESDVVVAGGSSWLAVKTSPEGEPPGEGWKLLASAGKRGEKGVPGERGRDGRDAPTIESFGFDKATASFIVKMSDGSEGLRVKLEDLLTGIKIDRQGYAIVLGDGGPRFSLRELFEQYDEEKQGG